MKVEIKPF